jgi:hypothetical protein
MFTEGAGKMSELTGKHEGGVRSFYILSEAYYGDTIREKLGYEDDIMVGIYHYTEDGYEDGTSGEFGIRWFTLGGKPCAQVQVFEDAFDVAFIHCADFLGRLSELTKQNPTKDQVKALLLELGYVDRTKRDDPYGRRRGADRNG